jgi:dTDP-4-dehydrorhamnose reductase
MKIVLIGGSSLIGQKLHERLKKEKYDVLASYNKSKKKKFFKFDIEKDDIEKKVKLDKGDIVFILAAISNPNEVFRDKLKSEIINIKNTKKIIRKIFKKKAKIVFFSSVEVFDGKKSKYSEKSTPDPLNLYGKQKRVIEKFLLSKFKNFVILRTSFVVGYNFKDRCPVKLTYETIKKPNAKMAIDNSFAITCVNDLVNLISFFLKSNQLFSKKILHIASPKTIIRYALASKIKQISKYKNKMKFEKAKFSEINFLEKRGRKNCLVSIHKKINNYRFKSLNKIIFEKTKILDKGM